MPGFASRFLRRNACLALWKRFRHDKLRKIWGLLVLVRIVMAGWTSSIGPKLNIGISTCQASN
jgi:hypothetical protein